MAWSLTTGTRSTPNTLPVMAAPLPSTRPERRTLAGLFHQPDGCIVVAELDDARIHGDADGDPHLDGVHADVVVQEVEHGDGVQVVDAAVAAVGPDRLVLGLLGQVVAVLVVVDAGALDDAAAVAAVGGVRRRAAFPAAPAVSPLILEEPANWPCLKL